jgi:hypothetical protein
MVRSWLTSHSKAGLTSPLAQLMNSYIDYCKKCNFAYNNVNKLWASKHIYSRFYKFAEQSKSHAMGRKVCFDINNFLKFFNISREDINDIVIDE